MKTAIIGGGISGLSAAYYLRKLSFENNFPLELTLFESSDSIGGVFDTINHEDLIIEQGPDSFITTKPWALELVRELGLENSLINTSEQNRRTFVYINGVLKALPEGFFMIAPTKILPFLKSDFFSWKGKLRILLELLIPAKKVEDESLYSFITRRFGKEALYKAAESLIGGIYTSDSKELSLRATMPEFLEMERKNGSVIRALMKRSFGGDKDKSGARYSMFYSLKNGMSSLIQKLRLQSEINSLQMNCKVSGISQSKNRWILSSNEKDEEFDSVVIATPAYISSNIIQRLDPQLSFNLSEIEYASSVVVNLIYNKSEFKNKPDGFGVVIPPNEKMNLIACSFYTEKFPERTNSDELVMRCFLGCEHSQEVINWDDEK
ncbi:MAG: protoporphyrinogen oxidase, partial [Thermodesulfobacteriota bacterium]